MHTLTPYFHSVLAQDTSSIVICDLAHTIIYMNPAACTNYQKYGGDALIGKSLLDCHNEQSCEAIKKVIAWFSSSPAHNRIHTFYNEKQNKDVYMIALRDENKNLIGYYEKHEFRTKDKTPFYKMD